ELDFYSYHFEKIPAIKAANLNNHKIIAVNLPGFAGLLSHFTQANQCFGDEFEGRLKVIACIEKPNMTHSEALEQDIRDEDWEKIRQLLDSKKQDAQIVFWGPADDIKTALETIEERCQMAFEGVPNETRKSFEDGSTVFERVLPGADRMYPDTDTAPRPLEDPYIEELRKDLPMEIIERYKQLKQWNVPEDTYTYIFSKNLYPTIDGLIQKTGIDPALAGNFIGQKLKFVEGHYAKGETFEYSLIIKLFEFLKNENLEYELAGPMLPVLYEHPKMDFASILNNIGFKRIPEKDITGRIPFLSKKFDSIRRKAADHHKENWIMGQLRKQATGNMKLNHLLSVIREQIHNNLEPEKAQHNE
ncbi:MAG: hypothetical protein R6U19_08010, partial [Bacteroidales bacterium]